MQPQIDRLQMKRDAKEVMWKHQPSVYLVALVYLLVSYLLTLLSTRLMYPQAQIEALLRAGTDAEWYQALLALSQQSAGARLLNIAIEIMSAMLGVGFTSFCLNAARGVAAGFGSLFDAFENFVHLLLLMILIGVFVFLWSLLLVVPGIIAAYRYSMAVYIMLDNPDKGALECIRESKHLTYGHKGELFFLDLTFIGWYLLAAIPFVSVYVEPYVRLTKSNYYRVLSGRWDAPEHVDVTV